MAQATWEKTAVQTLLPKPARARWQFLVGGGLILAAIAYLIISGTLAGAQYFITVNEVVGNPDYVGKTVRLSGVVLGDSIQYDSENLIIDFTVANIPSQFTDLGQALREAASDPNATQLRIHVEDQVKPDLLQHEAQAIVTGQLGSDGVFYASELLLKCPSRFLEAAPDAQSVRADA